MDIRIRSETSRNRPLLRWLRLEEKSLPGHLCLKLPASGWLFQTETRRKTAAPWAKTPIPEAPSDPKRGQSTSGNGDQISRMGACHKTSNQSPRKIMIIIPPLAFYFPGVLLHTPFTYPVGNEPKRPDVHTPRPQKGVFPFYSGLGLPGQGNKEPVCRSTAWRGT